MQYILECAIGRWGKNCHKSCSKNCLELLQCDIKSGVCIGGCVDGYKRPTCEQGN